MIGDAEQWPPSRASTGNNLARPSIATVDQIDDSSDLIEYGVPHVILGYQVDSVSRRISDLLQSLEHQLLRLDRSVGLRPRLGDFFRGCIPILHQVRIAKRTICPVCRKPTADSICAISHNHVSSLAFSIPTYRPI